MLGYSLPKLLRYFLKLGSVGFGGPLVLINHMHEELVLGRRWYSKEEYHEAFSFSQLSPGPTATQMAIYLAWLRSHVLGATLAPVIFILPSFILVTLLAEIYLRVGNLPWIAHLFYGVGASIIGIIAKSAYQLGRKTLGTDVVLWILLALSFLIGLRWHEAMLSFFFISGFVYLFIKSPPKYFKNRLNGFSPISLATGAHGAISKALFAKMIIYFFKIGAVVFGSGLVIVPFLHAGVVRQFHWITDQQFLDAVSVGMITPGPIVITAGFIGYLMGGLIGAIGAVTAIFAPCYLFVVCFAPLYRRFNRSKSVKAFVAGLVAAALGAIFSGAVVLGKQAIVDVPTVIIALIACGVLLYTKKIPEPVVILAAGLAGIALR